MCRQDLFHTPPPHLRRRNPPIPIDNSSEDEDDLDGDDDEERDFMDEFEYQSWLQPDGGNFVHRARIDNGELFTAQEIVGLFLNRQTIEECKNDAEKDEYYNSLVGMHSSQAWEAAYRKFIQGRTQAVHDLFTWRGPVCIDGQAVDADGRTVDESDPSL